MADSPVVAIEHVGIAVRDAETAKNRYRTMGFVDVRTEDLPGGIRSHLLRSGTAYVEILESTRDGSDLARFLARRGEGLHHLCLRVDSLAEATSVAESAGCGLVSGIPIEDVRGSRVFIHPATNDGVLTGLVEPHAVGCEAEPGPG
ncbi:MAG: VOC family protein [bacterium]|nr:VOC family protein [bacterium]MDE0438769.1 VOC family protein [bacterium]